MRSVRVNLKLWIQGRVGTPEPPDFRTYTEPFSLFLKSVSVVRNGPWGCMCDQWMRTSEDFRGSSSEQWPLLVFASALGHLSGSAAGLGVSHYNSHSRDGNKTRRGAFCMLVRCLQQVGSGEPQTSWRGAPQLSSAQDTAGGGTPEGWQQMLQTTIKNESCCHLVSDPKSQKWLAGSSPRVQRCFHSINKKQQSAFSSPLDFFLTTSLFEYFPYFSCNSFTLSPPQTHEGFCLQCSHRYSQHILWESLGSPKGIHLKWICLLFLYYKHKIQSCFFSIKSITSDESLTQPYCLLHQVW